MSGTGVGKVDVTDFPFGFAVAPVVWEYFGVDFDMEFIAGIVGVKQDTKTCALEPVVGWVIIDKGKVQK